MQAGRLSVTASRWPWQGYGWGPKCADPHSPMFRQSRFGGGWDWRLGVAIGGRTIMLELLFGTLVIVWDHRKDRLI